MQIESTTVEAKSVLVPGSMANLFRTRHWLYLCFNVPSEIVELMGNLFKLRTQIWRPRVTTKRYGRGHKACH